MPVSRRRTLHAAASLATLGSVAGCLETFRGGRVRIRIENGDDARHTVDVEFAQDGDPVFSERFTVDANTQVDEPDVVAPGEYSVTVGLDSTTQVQTAFDMAGCASNTLYVDITGPDELEAGVLDEC